MNSVGGVANGDGHQGKRRYKSWRFYSTRYGGNDIPVGIAGASRSSSTVAFPFGK